MARRKLIAGNWKMHKSAGEAGRLVRELVGRLQGRDDRDFAVCPPFTALWAAREALAGSRVLLGAQDLHWEDQGAFTGEVSGPMLVDAGCGCVIVGHSERRQLFGEIDAHVARKARAALRHRLLPIVCVGETLAEREAGRTEAVLSTQVAGSLEGLEPREVAGLVLAYEPVWAIGTGKVATEAQARDAHAHIRKVVAERFGGDAAETVRILYGGSVKPDNAAGLLAQPGIDGALVGGASLEAEAFTRICLS